MINITMKMNELLLERISVSSNTQQLQTEILSIVAEINNRTYKQFNLPEESKQYGFKLLVLLDAKITKFLTDKIKEIADTHVKIEFLDMDNESGSGGYVFEENKLKLHKKLLTNIANWAAHIRTQAAMGKTSNQQITINMLKTAIASLVKIFLHEITHVIQIKSAGKPYEKSNIYNKQQVDDYLSSLNLKTRKQQQNYKGDKEDLNKNRLNVFLARKDLNDPKNVDVYLAQPEEITAYAQELVSDFASKLVNKSKTQQLISINNFTNQLKTNQIQHPYSFMANSEDTKYKNVYRRFLKSVMQELVAFKEQL